jgi:hypothetical protein
MQNRDFANHITTIICGIGQTNNNLPKRLVAAAVWWTDNLPLVHVAEAKWTTERRAGFYVPVPVL